MKLLRIMAAHPVGMAVVWALVLGLSPTIWLVADPRPVRVVLALAALCAGAVIGYAMSLQAQRTR